jgi:hypothetical protein
MKLPQGASKEQRETFEERAAIKEFCANLPRDLAEREAYSEFLDQLRKLNHR